MRTTPPHILVTTPESLYVLLGSRLAAARCWRSVRTVIVDEIHAVAGSKRGSHLALSLERLDALCGAAAGAHRPVGDAEADRRGGALPGRRRRRRDGAPIARSSTSATPRSATSRWSCRRSPLEAVMSNEVWSRSTTASPSWSRSTAPRWSSSTRGAWPSARRATWPSASAREHVAAHHGSLAKEHRLDAEQRLKRGELKVLVATASLELGIDIGDVDLVCQLGSPRSIAAFLQRVGRSGHAVGGMPKGRLFPHIARRAGRVRGAARLRAPRRARRAAHPAGAARRAGAADRRRSRLPRMGRGRAVRRWCARAWPYRDLDARRLRRRACACSPRASPRGAAARGAYLHRDAVTGTLRGAARRAADRAHLRRRDPRHRRLRGACSSRRRTTIGTRQRGLRGREPGRRRLPARQHVATASCASRPARCGSRTRTAQPPNIPFWLGEAPGRSDELSAACRGCAPRSTQRLGATRRRDRGDRRWLRRRHSASTPTRRGQIVDYLAARAGRARRAADAATRS